MSNQIHTSETAPATVTCAVCGEQLPVERAAAFSALEIPWGDGAMLAHASPFECRSLTAEARLHFSMPRSQYASGGFGATAPLVYFDFEPEAGAEPQWIGNGDAGDPSAILSILALSGAVRVSGPDSQGEWRDFTITLAEVHPSRDPQKLAQRWEALVERLGKEGEVNYRYRLGLEAARKGATASVRIERE